MNLIPDLWGTESSLVTNVGSTETELLLEKVCESVVNLSSHPDTFGERVGSSWQDHELLDLKAISCMGSSINNVEGWHWHNKFVSWLSSELSQIVIQWHVGGSSTSSGGSERHGQDSVGS
jgi:hypothetical protein